MAYSIPSRAAIAAVLLILFCSASPSQEVPGQKDTATDAAVHHYVRAKDPKWYAKQLVPLRQELVKIDEQIRIMRQARKDGRGTTGAVNLDKAPEGVNADADLLLLQQHRTEVLKSISEIEDDARRNDLAPGAIRAEESTEEAGTPLVANDDAPISSPEIAETQEFLRQEKEHLERAKNETNLLQRKLDLDKRTVYSNPDYTLRQSGKAGLTVTENQIAEKQEEIQQTQQKIGDLEERLQDLKLNSNKTDPTAEPPVVIKAEEKKDEAYWRKQFSEIHYKIRMAQRELDISQRELNQSLMIYDPNPQKALRENVTRRNINAHRQAIEDKKKEIAELKNNLSDLEDELRHAGGDPGWSRE